MAMSSYPQYKDFIDALKDYKEFTLSFTQLFKGPFYGEVLEQYASLKERFDDIASKGSSPLNTLSGKVSKEMESHISWLKKLTLDRGLTSENWKKRDDKRIKSIIENFNKLPKDAQEKECIIGESGHRYIKYTTHPLRGCADRLDGEKVLLYLDADSGKKVVLKKEDPHHGACYSRDKDALMKLDCPYIPKVCDYAETKAYKAIFIEYIDYPRPVIDYAFLVRNNPKELLRLCRETVEGIKALKDAVGALPENKGEHFLVDSEGHVKFVDFDSPPHSSTKSWWDSCKDRIFYNCDKSNEVINKIRHKLDSQSIEDTDKMLDTIKELEKDLDK